METEKCRVLLCALDCGSFTAAAEKLGYTTSGISRMMAALETETGFPLFKRYKGGVEATAECAELIPIMRELVHQADVYEQKARSIKGLETGTVTVGAAYGAYYSWLARLTAEFCRRYPGVKVSTLWGRSSDLNTALHERKADLCVISRRDDNCKWISLHQDELLVLLPANHPLAKGNSVPVSILETEPFIEIYPGEETDNSMLFKKLGIKPSVRYTSNDTLVACSMVEAGLGITLMNSVLVETLRSSVIALPLDPAYNVEIGIALPEDGAASPAAEKFIEFAMKHIDEI